jgi:hypothetical protein
MENTQQTPEGGMQRTEKGFLFYLLVATLFWVIGLGLVQLYYLFRSFD